MSRTIAFIQARCSSSRFPNKVLAPLDGTTMIEFMVARARNAKRLDDIVVLTSTDASDDPLVTALERAQIPVHRGDLADVLGRFASAAARFPADTYVRLTGDCPLVDPAVIDAVVWGRKQHGVMYASNVAPATFPDGLDVECFSAEALSFANEGAQRSSEREHVTLWMRSEQAHLSQWTLLAPCDMSNIRLTVDYPDDLAVVQRLISLLPAPRQADLYDCLRVIAATPDLATSNVHARNEGLEKSLVKDSVIRSQK